jgi:hypothetical protein
MYSAKEGSFLGTEAWWTVTAGTSCEEPFLRGAPFGNDTCSVLWVIRVQVSVLCARAGVYYGGCMDGVMEITTDERNMGWSDVI